MGNKCAVHRAAPRATRQFECRLKVRVGLDDAVEEVTGARASGLHWRALTASLRPSNAPSVSSNSGKVLVSDKSTEERSLEGAERGHEGARRETGVQAQEPPRPTRVSADVVRGIMRGFQSMVRVCATGGMQPSLVRGAYVAGASTHGSTRPPRTRQASVAGAGSHSRL